MLLNWKKKRADKINSDVFNVAQRANSKLIEVQHVRLARARVCVSEEVESGSNHSLELIRSAINEAKA